MKQGFVIFSSLLMIACTSSQSQTSPVELKHFALNSVEDVRATTGVSFDRQTSSDGKGSLRIDAEEPMIVPLFEVTDVSIENATLIYQASLQSQKLDGKAFLEMWVRLPGKGEFFSRGLDRPIKRRSDCLSWSCRFFCRPDKNRT